MRKGSSAKIGLRCSLWTIALSFVAAAFALIMQSNEAPTQTAPARLLIDHVNILDGHGGRAVKGRVLIANGRIVQVLPDSGQPSVSTEPFPSNNCPHPLTLG